MNVQRFIVSNYAFLKTHFFTAIPKPKYGIPNPSLIIAWYHCLLLSKKIDVVDSNAASSQVSKFPRQQCSVCMYTILISADVFSTDGMCITAEKSKSIM